MLRLTAMGSCRTAIEIVVFHLLSETKNMKNLQFIRRLSDFVIQNRSIWVLVIRWHNNAKMHECLYE